MPAYVVEHMVEEAYSGGNGPRAGPIQAKFYLNVSLGRLSCYRCGSHDNAASEGFAINNGLLLLLDKYFKGLSPA